MISTQAIDIIFNKFDKKELNSIILHNNFNNENISHILNNYLHKIHSNNHDYILTSMSFHNIHRDLTNPSQNPIQNLKTIHPEIPNFASDRHALHKVAGVCVKTQYTRFFTVDQENLKYYVDADASQVKKTLELKDSEAFIQKKASFMEQQKKGKVEGGQGWVEPNCEYRIGIKLTGR